MRDASSLCCIKDGIDFFERINPVEARKYGHKLAIEGAKLIAQKLGTDLLIKNEEMIPCMCCLEVPEPLELVMRICQKLLKSGICLLYFIEFDSKVYLRVCGWVQNEMEDYEKLADLLLSEIQIQK